VHTHTHTHTHTHLVAKTSSRNAPNIHTHTHTYPRRAGNIHTHTHTYPRRAGNNRTHTYPHASNTPHQMVVAGKGQIHRNIDPEMDQPIRVEKGAVMPWELDRLRPDAYHTVDMKRVYKSTEAFEVCITLPLTYSPTPTQAGQSLATSVLVCCSLHRQTAQSALVPSRVYCSHMSLIQTHTLTLT
jgi:hypothetical protein